MNLTSHPYPAHRFQAIIWARSVMADDTTVFLDTETTGLGATARIVDLAVIDLRGVILLETLINPHMKIPPDATRVHGISDAMVAGAPRIREIVPELLLAIGTRRVVIYNCGYDKPLIETAVSARNMLAPVRSWECAMLQYARFRGEINSARGEYRWPKLTLGEQEFQLSAGNHRALGDAISCRGVVMGMAARSTST